MNDDIAGQLTDSWQIPAWAQDRLWLDTEAGSAQCEGAQGLFELPAPAQVLTLRWNSDAGVPLTQLRWQIDNLQWDGRVRLGGLVEGVHLTQLPDIDFAMAVVMVSAQPLRPETTPYPDATQRNAADFGMADYLDGVDDYDPPLTVPLLTFADSPLVAIAQDALTQHHPMHFYGALDASESHWHDFFALPIIWESVTVFAP